MDMLLSGKTLILRCYTINKALFIIKQVKLTGPKKFIIAILNADGKIFVIYMIIQKQEKISVHSKSQVQIEGEAYISMQD